MVILTILHAQSKKECANVHTSLMDRYCLNNVIKRNPFNPVSLSALYSFDAISAPPNASKNRSLYVSSGVTKSWSADDTVNGEKEWEGRQGSEGSASARATITRRTKDGDKDIGSRFRFRVPSFVSSIEPYRVRLASRNSRSTSRIAFLRVARSLSLYWRRRIGTAALTMALQAGSVAQSVSA